MFRKTTRRTNWISIISMALITGLMLTAFVSVGTAYADEGDDPNRARTGDWVDERLEACLERLNEWYEVQDANIGRARGAIARIEAALGKAAELGIDTSAIEALMPGLYEAVEQAEAFHARAGEILSEHAGFNGGGKVKDHELALETCRSGRDALASARDALLRARDIVHEIIDLVRDLRDNYVRPTDAIS